MTGNSLVIGKGNEAKQKIESSFNTGLSLRSRCHPDAIDRRHAGNAPSPACRPRPREPPKYLKRLQEELQKPKPNRKWYSVRIDGLIKATENVGKVGVPVIELAGKLLKLLNP